MDAIHEKILSPPNYKEIEGPCIFLAGPIQGTDRWQDEAAKLILENDSNVNIFSPRRPPGQGKKESGGFNARKYAEQVDWETNYLNYSSTHGVILFWLAKEAEHNCTRAFAQTSRFELGEWKVKHEINGILLVVGIESGFTGDRYVKRRFGQDCPNVPVLSTLEETCRVATGIAVEKFNNSIC